MTPEELREQFDVLGESPNGVQTLRELVLQLAVRGRLVAQNAEDEPASLLRERVALDRTATGSLARRGSKRAEAFSALSSLDTPPNWVCARLGDLLRVQNGYAFDSKAFSTAGEGVPLIRIRDLSAERTTVSYAGHFRDEFLVRSGDFLVGMDGNFELREWRGGPALLNQRVCRLCEVSEGVDRRFLFWVVKVALTEIHEATSFVTVKHLSSKSIESIRFPIPPLAEQRRIAARVDELMALCDELEARQLRRAKARTQFNRVALHQLTNAGSSEEVAEHWERLRENMDNMFDAPEALTGVRRTILQLAVQGRLVPQVASEEPASMLQKQIAAARSEMPRSNLEGAPLASELDLPQLPSGWIWARFGDVVFNRDGERVPLSSEIRAGRKGPYPYYGASGVIDYIDDYLFDKTLLLIGEDGANLLLRSTPIAYFASGKYWVNNHAHVIDGISLDLLRYLAIFINSIDLAPYVTGTAQPKLNQAKLNSIPVPLPPAAEQARIVARVDELLSLCDALESRLTEARDKATHLAAAVVHRITAA